MKYFVFRNMTIERFFQNKETSFSGYEDISYIDSNADRYIWFYLSPMKMDSKVVADEIRNYIDLLNLTISQIPSDKMLIVFTMREVFGLKTLSSDRNISDAISYYNSSLFSLASENSNIKVVDFVDFLNKYPQEELFDWKYYLISQMALNPRLAKPFHDWFNTQIDSIDLIRKKCLVLDLDNTLWGGVLGEDGIEGVALGGDYPGKVFSIFQKQIKELGKQGVILTVCSKNNIEDVREIWKKHPDIILNEDSFAAIKIDWSNKADNIRNLALELNIGLDSMVFIDDNPAERELIKLEIPEVITPDFPDQPYMLPAFFKDLAEKYFSVYSLTEEDLSKTKQYKENAARNSIVNNFTNIDEYIRSLDIKLNIAEVNKMTITRVAQMTQKTNQFNLTTYRYTDSDIMNFMNSGAKVYTLSVGDKFGDNGITGVCICEVNDMEIEINSLLLSCRILGKGIEDAFMYYILNELKSQGYMSVKAKYISTPKNIQVNEFFEKIGFDVVEKNDNSKVYIINLKHKNIEMSDKYKYINN